MNTSGMPTHEVEITGGTECSGSVNECCCLVELIHDSAGQFAALAAFAGYSELGTNIGHATGTTTTQVADLVISNLTTNTDVHGAFLSVGSNLNDNENDCQQVLDLLRYSPRELSPVRFNSLNLKTIFP